MLEIADIFEPGSSRFRGMLLLDLQEIMAVQAKREFENGLLTREGTQVSSKQRIFQIDT